MNTEILNSGLPPSLPGQYNLLQLEKLIRDNVQTLADLERLHCALGILIKYGCNLLKGAQRPKMWNRVNFTNKVFSSKVDCIKGCRDVLSNLGYTEKTPEGVSFPENVEPNINHVRCVVTELYVAQKELDAYIEHRHPQPAWIDKLMPNNVMLNAGGSDHGAEGMGGASSGSSVDPPMVVDHGASAAMQATGAGQVCDICGGNAASWLCNQCEDKVLCDNCDEMWHKHPRRRQHRRTCYTPSRAPEAAAPEPEPELEPILPVLLSCFESEHESQAGKQHLTENNHQRTSDNGANGGGFNNCGGARPKTTNQGSVATMKPAITPGKGVHSEPINKETANAKMDLGSDLQNMELQRVKLIQQSLELEMRLKTNGKEMRQIIIHNNDFIRDPRYVILYDEKLQILQQQEQVDAELQKLSDASPQGMGSQLSKGEPQSVPLPPRDNNPHHLLGAHSVMNPVGNQGDAAYATMTTAYHGRQHPPRGDINQGMSPAVSAEFAAVLAMEQANRPQKQFPLTPPTKVAETANLGVPTESDWTCGRCTYRNGGQRDACEMCMNGRPPKPAPEKGSDKKSLVQKGFGWVKSKIGMGSSVKEGKVDNSTQQLPRVESPAIMTMQPRLPPASDAWRAAANDLGLVDMHGQLVEIDRRKQEQQVAIETRRIIQILRNAERDGFTPAEMQHAWPQYGIDGVPGYLRDQWSNRITLALSDLEKYPGRENQIRQLLIENNADVKTVMEKARKFDEEMLSYLQKLSDLPADTVATFLCSDKEQAKADLVKHKLQQIRHHVWSPNQMVDEEERNVKLEELVKNKEIDNDRRTRAILVEKQMAGWMRADMVVDYISKATISPMTTLQDVVQAAKDCRTKNEFSRFLENECPVCIDLFPESKMRLLGMCQDRICLQCFQTHFELSIRERAVLKLVCPVCGLPDMADRVECQDYFNILGLQFRNTLSREAIELFEKKVRDWHLLSNPCFCWCSHCDNGMINEEKLMKMQCNSCGKLTCFKCKKPWQPQHEGLTCEKFYEWQKANDPEFQKAGLEKHLAENGIECPQCKFRYALAKGGCIHFTCTQCKYEFCCGCRMPFRKGGNKQLCRNLPICMGLHCHHPRDCLYYLRDWDVAKLQKLLRDRRVNFLTEKMLSGEEPNQTCPVMEQKELPDGLMDEGCGRPVEENHAGLCRVHYKEYLVSLINQNRIDPVVEMDLVELEQTLHRSGIQVPNPFANEQDIMYLGRLRIIITERIDLLRHE